jgi:peptide/nickel transport system ATP-binding protein
VLRVKNVTIMLRDGKQTRSIAEDISFSLETGQSLGIVGESGSGKTITSLALMKLLPPEMFIASGEILFDTEKSVINLASLSEKQMQSVRGKQLSMIFQEPMTSLNPSMRCGEQVAEAVRQHTQLQPAGSATRVFSLMKEVQLPGDPDFYSKYPHQLSGGQRQRVMIAIALAGNPRLLIADEPTTALDVTVQKKILDLLIDIIRNRRMSLIFISHDLGVVRSICNDALVMYRGKVVETGSITELFRRPEHPYTRGLIACRPQFDHHPERLPTLDDFMGTEPETTPPARMKKSRTPGKHGRISREENALLFEVRNLGVEYSLRKNIMGKSIKSLKAVDDFSFSIYKGETVGLIGESGSGKSSLGMSLIKLIRSGEGEIRYRGSLLSEMRGKELIHFRQKVQFIFQDPFSSLNPRITAGSSIMEVMKVHGMHVSKKERQKATLELLERVGMEPGHFDRFPHEFSGGQRQRIGLARALATHPELIICDESVSSLDVSVQARILNLMNDLKNAMNLTYLFISHDLLIVRYMSDRILVMKNGQLMEEGSGEDIFSKPTHDYTRELIGSIRD